MTDDPGPWITYSAIRWLQTFLHPRMRVFEWGAGQSTVWFAQRVHSIITVEDDPSWFRQVMDQIGEAGVLNAQVNLIQPSEDLGWDLYAGAIDGYEIPFDLIYIDGHLKSRLFCAGHAIRAAGENTVILLDNSDTTLEAAALLKGWAAEYATFYGAGSGKQEWETTFYYPKTQGNPLHVDL